ncbi:MAG: CbbQ/NirQ/NorQ C-terminal domain-containing protein, partial [Roseinatronobacter sp.]|nr:CbbQ/NirQ/NorQ C-terminal domain-containing protein [Roseinatronobacter sp.]
LKDLKESTKQRFCALEFDYPAAEIETAIIASEAGIAETSAALLVRIGQKSRNLRGQGLNEGASSRMLIHAGRLMAQGLPLSMACRLALITPITDDPDMRSALEAAVDACA